ncbi:NADPH-dependent FMN reductase [Microbacterium sp. YY-01]|uniref:NADPH-dependent FMN reductase n=1 Tax=Microbacterium sp. YY-01 TaxID=3421634 RepID=UPI003D17CF6B
MKIGIIVGSIRQQRATEAVAQYVYAAAEARAGSVEYSLIDVRDYDLPLLTDPVHPMLRGKQYDDERVQRWSDTIDALDGFIFVTPEYNHGVPGGMKNAVDLLGPEWKKKAAAFVAHGSVGGVRAVEQWRQILANFSMFMARAELNFNAFTHWSDGVFTPEPRHEAETTAMFDELEALAAIQ